MTFIIENNNIMSYDFYNRAKHAYFSYNFDN